MRILCTGVNHKTAGLALRERLAFDDSAARSALGALREQFADAEWLILSTCNRTEIYCARPVHGHPREGELTEWLGRFHGLPASAYIDSVYSFTDAGAVRHLLEVAAGLDSLVLGEAQVLGQVRAAYQRASEAGTVGPAFNQLFQLALRSAKRVRTQTALDSARLSVAGAAVDFAAHTLGSLAGLTVVGVGAGKVARQALADLARRGACPLVVLNRSPAPAAALAGAVGGQAGPLSDLPAWLARADVVLASTGADAPVLTAAAVTRAMATRPDRPLLVLDLAVPRDAEPAVGDLPGVTLANLDDLQRFMQTAAGPALDELARCHALLDAHAAEWADWLAAREVTPTIAALRRHVRAIAEQEVRTALNKFADHDDAELDERILRRAVHRVVQRVLHQPITALRDTTSQDAARAHAAALRRLFDLDPNHTDES